MGNCTSRPSRRRERAGRYSTGRYEAGDPVDEYLLARVARHVDRDNLGLFARELGLTSARIKKLEKRPISEQIRKVSIINASDFHN